MDALEADLKRPPGARLLVDKFDWQRIYSLPDHEFERAMHAVVDSLPREDTDES